MCPQEKPSSWAEDLLSDEPYQYKYLRVRIVVTVPI